MVGIKSIKRIEMGEMMKVNNICDFGAKKNSPELQTQFIQKAIDDCYACGGGVVEIPKGDFHTGGIRLRSNVTLHLSEDARLYGSRNPEDYFAYIHDKVEPLGEENITNAPFVHALNRKNLGYYKEDNPDYYFRRIVGSRWNNAIIRAAYAENAAIIGEKGSVIDGCNCYDAKGEEGYRGPHAIMFYKCNNIRFEGYTVRNSGNWAHNILYCNNIRAKKLKVEAGHDGFHVAASRNIFISDSCFYTGDDCIAGFANVNAVIENCTLNSSCSALRFGGTNVLIAHCHIYGPGKYGFRGAMTDEEKKEGAPSTAITGRNNMLSAYTYFADYTFPIKYQQGNIVMTDCRIENADRFLHYNYSGNELWQKGGPLNDISFKNIEASGISMPINLYGAFEKKVALNLENVSIAFKNELNETDLINACNFECINIKNVKVQNIRENTVIRTWSDGRVNIDNEASGSSITVEKAKEIFKTDWI